MYARFYVKCPLILSRFNQTWVFENIFENTKISNFMKIFPVVVEFFYADRLTDMAKLTVAFLNFANALKKYLQKSFRLSRTRRWLGLFRSQFSFWGTIMNVYKTQHEHCKHTLLQTVLPWTLFWYFRSSVRALCFKVFVVGSLSKCILLWYTITTRI
jgi:hypothetical protein